LTALHCLPNTPQASFIGGTLNGYQTSFFRSAFLGCKLLALLIVLDIFLELRQIQDLDLHFFVIDIGRIKIIAVVPG